MVDIQVLNALDEALIDSARDVKPLYYAEPINGEEQKKEFLSGNILNPKFLYKGLEYDPKDVTRKLTEIEVPDDELGKIFQKKKRNVLLENRVIANRGDRDIVVQATITIHGFPNQELVAYADKLLGQTPSVVTPKNLPSSEVRHALQQALYSFGLMDWKVDFSDKRLTTVYAAEKKITVCKDRKFSEADPKRLAVHEVGVHALRAANGYEQPLKIFAVGLPGYLPTEEGLTSYHEKMIGNTSEETSRRYAALVIAVDSVCQGLDFKQTFDRLKSYDLSNNYAWNLSVRAHRAGGYIKDHVYLEGYLKVKNFAETDGDFNTLYIGKIGIEDLRLVRRLLQEGVLVEAKYKPFLLE